MSDKLLLLLLYLSGGVLANEQPDVDCIVLRLEVVQCLWGTPEVNYTFHGWFYYDKNDTECPNYLVQKGIRVGCVQPYGMKENRFYSFFTNLQHGSSSFRKELQLKNKVKLSPPSNLTMKVGSDSNLWYYWNRTSYICEENQVRYRINNGDWMDSPAALSYCINLPSNSSLYELQVRTKMASNCGQSIYWSDWSESVLWGSNTIIKREDSPTYSDGSPWRLMVSCTSGVLAVVLVVAILWHRERVRIILMPVVPKPSFSSYDIQDWLSQSKGRNQSFKPNYNERACPVREYNPVSMQD